MCEIYSKHESEAVHAGHSCIIVQTGFKNAAFVAVFWSLESIQREWQKKMVKLIWILIKCIKWQQFFIFDPLYFHTNVNFLTCERHFVEEAL